MSQKKSVRVCVAGLVFACALVGTSSTRTHADAVVSTITVGEAPQAVAINPAGTFAYVVNRNSDTVSKIDLTNFTVTTTIAVGSNPYDVEINPAGTFAYVTHSQVNTVSKIDLGTNGVSTINLGQLSRGIAINPAGTFAYVAVPNSPSGVIKKINLATNGVTSFTVGAQPIDVAINPAGTFAYVTDQETNTVSKIDLATDTVTGTITVSTSMPQGIAINPAGTFAYVAVPGQSAIAKINLTNFTVTTTIAVGSNPYDVEINPAGTFAYAVNLDTFVLKINLATDTVTTITGGNTPRDLAINPAGTFAYVVNERANTVSKINLTATELQSITFTAVSTQLLGAKTVALSATASSTLAVAFTSATPTVCTVSGSTVTMVTIGDCTINANQAGGSNFDAAPQVSKTFTILPSPPAGEVGVSIKNGDSYTNSKQVTLNLVWPEYATSVRISNDGGFAASKTQTKDLAASIDWVLDDSVKGIYTKVVYIRFNGVADTTKTYTDDIILDTTAPTIESSSAAVASSSVDVSLKATDDITGVSKVQVRNDTKTVTKDYATKVSVPLADLSLSVSSSGVRKSATTAVEIRVSDNAGNWTGWRTITVAGLTKTPAVTTPAVTTSKSATAKSIATFAKIPVTSTSKVSLKVVSSSAKYCKVSGTTLKGVKAGTCKVTVTVTPKKGRATSKTVTLKVTK